jgi:pre-mRNA-splicing factor SYF2
MQKRLEAINAKREQAKQLNKKALLKENTKVKQVVNLKQEKKRRIAEDLVAERDAVAKGVDPERLRNINYSIQDVEKWDQKLQDKNERTNTGFTDYAQVSAKKYRKLVSEISPDIDAYNKLKDSDTSKPSKQAIDNLAKEITDQQNKRGQFSRRRAFKEDEDVYIFSLILGTTSTTAITDLTKRLLELMMHIQKKSRKTLNVELLYKICLKCWK